MIFFKVQKFIMPRNLKASFPLIKGYCYAWIEV
jgi:hypothetical protein